MPRLHKSQKVKVGIAAGIFLLAVVIGLVGMTSGGRRYREVHQHWYYDLGDNQLFETKIDQHPPIEAPSGPGPDGKPAGVRAHVFACTNCDDADARFIGYLETYTPEGKALKDRGDFRAAAKFRLLREPDGSQWVKAQDPPGAAVVAQAIGRCPKGSKLQPCTPP